MHSWAGTGTGDRQTTTKLHHVFPKRGVTVSHTSTQMQSLFFQTPTGTIPGTELGCHTGTVIDTGTLSTQAQRTDVLAGSHFIPRDCHRDTMAIWTARRRQSRRHRDTCKITTQLPFDSAIPGQELYPPETPLHLTHVHGYSLQPSFSEQKIGNNPFLAGGAPVSECGRPQVKYKAVGRTRAPSHRDHHTVTRRVTASLCHQGSTLSPTGGGTHTLTR